MLNISNYISFSKIERENEEIVKDLIPIKTEVGYILTALVNQETGVRGYVATGEDRFLEPYYFGKKELEMVVPKLLEHASDKHVPIIDVFKNKGLPVIEELDSYFQTQIEIRRDGQIEEAQKQLGYGKQMMDHYREVNSELNQLLDQSTLEAYTTLQNSSETSRKSNILTGVVALMIGFMAIIYFYRTVRTEVSLKESELRFRSVIESANDGIIITDGNLRLFSWNEAAKRLFGYEEWEMENRFLKDFFPIRYQEVGFLDKKHILSQEEDGLVGRTIEIIGMKKGGKEFPLEMALNSWVIGDKRYFSIIIRDISRRREFEETLIKQAQDLAQSNMDLEQFAYIASHDLQEPLRMVSSYVSLLERRYKGALDDDADEFITYAVSGTKRMHQLVSDLYKYTRLVKTELQIEEVSLEEIAQRALQSLEPHNGKTVNLAYLNLPRIQADYTELVQMFTHLFSNSIKFNKNTLVNINISVTEEKDHWKIEVTDNGIGIPEEYFQKIFIIFQRLHPKELYPGTGIGLAVCKKIVERHQGTIWLQSEEGSGTTFYITLPKK